MTLARGHELGLALAAIAACLSVLLSGALPAAAWLVVLAPVVAAGLKLRGRSAPPISGIAIGLTALSIGVVTVVTRGASSAVIGGTYAVMGLLAARTLTRATYAHDVQSLLLALVVVFAGAALNNNISYAPSFLAFAIASVFSLTTRQLLDSAQRTYGEGPRLEDLRRRRDVLSGRFFSAVLGITLVVLSATAVIFAVFPRVGFGNLSSLHNPGSGLPDDVTLSSGAVRVLDPGQVAARVRGVSRAAFDRGLYLRGPVYDVLTEAGFAKSPARLRGRAPLAKGPTREVYEIQLQPFSGELLFSLGDIWSLRHKRGGTSNPNLRFRLPVGQDARGEMRARESVVSVLAYEISGTLSAAGYLPPERRASALREVDEAYLAHFRQLPEDLDPRIVELARRLTAGAPDDAARAAALRAHLERFRYTLDDKPSTGATPLVDFLFNHQSGHCEFFAAAYALLLRAAGIPARVVGGFASGRWDEESNLILFTGANAHVWVERLDVERGWILEDATPVAGQGGLVLEGTSAFIDRILRFWDDTVIDYAFSDQQSALRALGDLLRGLPGPWILLVALALVAAVVVVARLSRRRRRAARDPLTDALERYLARARGAPVDASETLREAARGLSSDQAAVLTPALELYELDRFGPGASPAALRAAARSLDRAGARR